MTADERLTPTLESALCAALLARAPELPIGAIDESIFEKTVGACDAADLAFRASIEATLPAAAARDVLAATKAFRANVRAVRAGASVEASRFAAPAASGGRPDPLDVVTPRSEHVSHVAAVRLADISDRARAKVATLRERANAQIEPVLSPAVRDALIAAKRARLVAFRDAIRAALEPSEKRIGRYSETIDSLATLVDGWY